MPGVAGLLQAGKKASITASYRSSEKISVTLTLTPAERVSVMADSPSTVAGILM